jgi:hypothetical protein
METAGLIMANLGGMCLLAESILGSRYNLQGPYNLEKYLGGMIIWGAVMVVGMILAAKGSKPQGPPSGPYPPRRNSGGGNPWIVTCSPLFQAERQPSPESRVQDSQRGPGSPVQPEAAASTEQHGIRPTSRRGHPA